MIIDYVLNSCKWTPLGLECPDANVALVVHKFLREAILDRHMYVCKCTGFDVMATTQSRPHTGTYISRHPLLGDSYPEIMVRLQDKVFLTNKSCVARGSLPAGENYVDTTDFHVDGAYTIKAIAPDKYLCRVLNNNVILTLQLSYDCGYRSCANNSRALKNDFFPCNTDFYVGEFFRVLPPVFGSNIVRVNYYHGATSDVLRLLLSNWADMARNMNVRKEELSWLLSFAL